MLFLRKAPTPNVDAPKIDFSPMSVANPVGETGLAFFYFLSFLLSDD